MTSPAEHHLRTPKGRTPARRPAGPGPDADTESTAAPYEAALRTGDALYLRRADGTRAAVDVARWRAAADAADISLVARCTGPTLDIGCGPGRLAAALVRRGIPVLGVDVSREAVRLTIAGGAACLRRSVFEQLPGEGRWSGALLADGNIGIGGDPAALLDRVAALLRRGGVLLAETDPDDADAHERFAVRVEDGRGGRGRPFRWARVGSAALARLAPAHGFAADETWRHSGRTFVALRRG